MKQLIYIFLIILIFNLDVISQAYVPFPTENVNWNVYYLGTCFDAPPDTTLLRFTIHGDTIINETTYKKLCIETGDTINPEIKSFGGLREENKRIYFKGTLFLPGGAGIDWGVEDCLLYDFNKQIGETIYHYPDGWLITEILGIDSILIGESYRKRFKVSTTYSYYHPVDYIVEGIGSIVNGLLGLIIDIPTCGYHYWEHVCFKENGEVKYLNPKFEDCFSVNLITGINSIEEESEVKIYPNPFIDEIQIANLKGNNLSLKILDISGSFICEQQLNGTEHAIKLDVLPGIYILLITNDKGQIIYKQQIIKQ